MWNFKCTLWNSTQNILPIRWKIRLLYNVEILRALRFNNSHAFWNTLTHPHGPLHCTPGNLVDHFLYSKTEYRQRYAGVRYLIEWLNEHHKNIATCFREILAHHAFCIMLYVSSEHSYISKGKPKNAKVWGAKKRNFYFQILTKCSSIFLLH